MPLSSHGGDRPRRGGSPPPCLGHLCIDVMGCLVQVAYRPGRRFVHLSASKCPCVAPVSLARFDKRHKDAVPASPSGTLTQSPLMSATRAGGLGFRLGERGSGVSGEFLDAALLLERRLLLRRWPKSFDVGKE